MILFEIVGFYGSGKSTISKKMYEIVGKDNCFMPESIYLKKNNIFHKFFYRLKHSFVYFDNDNRYIAKTIINKIHDKDTIKFVKNYFYLLCCFYYDILKSKKEYSILSEGFVCLNWIIHKYSKTSFDGLYKQKYYAKLLKYTHFVLVRSEFELNFNFLLERNGFHQDKQATFEDYLACNSFFREETTRINNKITYLNHQYDLRKIDFSFLNCTAKNLK